MVDSSLTLAFFDTLVEREPVQRVLESNAEALAVRFDDENRRIIIEMTRGVSRADQQDRLHSVLYALISSAESLGVQLTVNDFQVINPNAGAADDNPLSSMRGSFQAADAQMLGKLEQRAVEPKTYTLPPVDEIRERLAVAKFASPHKTAVALQSMLGDGYEVLLGSVAGNPAIRITSRSVIDQVLDRAGIIQIEARPEVAQAIVKAFKHGMGREPHKGEIVIGDDRQADTGLISRVARAAKGEKPLDRWQGPERDKDRGPSMGSR